MGGAGIGMGIGPVLAGFLKDWTGIYDWSILLSFSLSLMAVFCILFLPSSSRRQIPDWEDALPLEARTSVSGAGSSAIEASDD
jgi:MFS family permease